MSTERGPTVREGWSREILSCGDISASRLLESLISPWGTVVDWFLCLSKSPLVE